MHRKIRHHTKEVQMLIKTYGLNSEEELSQNLKRSCLLPNDLEMLMSKINTGIIVAKCYIRR